MRLFYFLYGGLLLSLVVFSYGFVDVNLIYLKYFYTGLALGNRLLFTFLYIIFVTLFFVFYWKFLNEVRKKILSYENLKKLIFLTITVLVFSYPAVTSFDIFNYVASAKTTFFYNENPYVIMPIEFIGDPLLLFTHAANKIALYGPLWIGLTGIPFLLSFGNFVVAILLLKLMAASFYAGIVFLIWKMTRSLFAVALFAFNPLVVLETLVSGHNDVVMMFFALLSFYFLKNKRILYGVIFLSLSILIKYATIFLIPVFVYTTWKIINKREVNWNNTFIYVTLSMFVVFILSFLREEIYPWYAIWFLTFVPFVYKNKILFYTLITFSFGLLLRHVPFMLIGTHFGYVPLVKNIVTFSPPFFVLAYLYFRKKYG